MSPPEAPSLVADCDSCFALCCVLLPFAAVSGFGIDKPGGTPCPNLADDDRCSIHATLREDGWAGCVTFDCFGAGQQVSQVTYAGVSWREHDNLPEMAAVLSVMRVLHEMLAHLTEVGRRSPDPAAADLAAEIVRMTGSHPERAARHRPRPPARPGRCTPSRRPAPDCAAAPAYRGRDLAGRDLRDLDLRDADLRGSTLIRADLRGLDLGRADLLGADLRDADVRGSRLADTLFLAQTQVNAARGDGSRRCPNAHPPRALALTAVAVAGCRRKRGPKLVDTPVGSRGSSAFSADEPGQSRVRRQTTIEDGASGWRRTGSRLGSVRRVVTAARSASRVAASSAASSSLRDWSAATWCSSSRMRRTPSMPTPPAVSVRDLAQQLDVAVAVAAAAAAGAARHDQAHPLVGAQRLRVQAGQLRRHRDHVDGGVGARDPGLTPRHRWPRRRGWRAGCRRRRRRGSRRSPRGRRRSAGPGTCTCTVASRSPLVPSFLVAPRPRTRKVRAFGVPAGIFSVTGEPPRVGIVISAPRATSSKDDRDVEGEVVALAAEQPVGRHLHRDEQVAVRAAALTRSALAAQPDALAVLHPGRDAGLDGARGGAAARAVARRAGLVVDQLTAAAARAGLVDREPAARGVHDEPGAFALGADVGLGAGLAAGAVAVGAGRRRRSAAG